MTAQAPHHPLPLSRVIDAVAALRDACAACVEAVDPGAPTAPSTPSTPILDALTAAREEGFAEAVDAAINALYELPTVDGEQPLVTIVRAREAVRALRPPPLQGTFNIG